MQILNIKNIEFEKQGKILFKIEKLSINTGDIIGLIGKNGSGKTTLLKYIDDLLKGADPKDLKFNKVYMKTHRRSGLLISKILL